MKTLKTYIRLAFKNRYGLSRVRIGSDGWVYGYHEGDRKGYMIACAALCRIEPLYWPETGNLRGVRLWERAELIYTFGPRD